MKRTATQLEFNSNQSNGAATVRERSVLGRPAIHQRKPKFQSPYCQRCYHQHKHCTCNRPNP